MALREPKETSAPENRSLLAPIAQLAKRKETFRRSLAVVLVNALANIRTFPEICRLIRTKPFFDALRGNPRFILRCLTRDYLVRGLSVGVSARCFLYHHRRLHLTLSPELVRKLTLDEATLYEASDEVARVSVTLGQTVPPHDKEGELDISLQVDGKPVSLLSFTVVPGWVAGSEAPEVLLISRMQGILGCYPEIKMARKVLADVAPNALLLAALQGIALGLGIDQVASVSSAQQSVYREDIAERLHRAYEEFFGELGIEKNDAGFLVTSVPLAEKPMSAIKAGHKLRTKEKREVKLAVKTSSFEFIRAHLVKHQVGGVTLIRQRSAPRGPAPLRKKPAPVPSPQAQPYAQGVATAIEATERTFPAPAIND